MKRLANLGLAALVALAFGPASHAFASVTAQGKVVRITLIDQNGSAEDGAAQFTDQGDGTTKVDLIMQNVPEGVEQPAHIHKGTCTTLDPNPAYPLETIKASKSTTIVKVALADLLKAKYAVNVHKSVAEAGVYVSCGALPSQAAVSGGTMTLDQALSTMLDQANEILGTVQKKEVDASKNAYIAYNATFAANEGAIQAKDAATQATLETAMRDVNTAITAGNYAEAATAAQELINEIKAAQTKLGTAGGTGGAADADLEAAFQKLQAAAATLVSETGKQDKPGAQQAYNDYNALFAANEGVILAKDAATQATLETRMREVRDALASGNLADAAQAAKELQDALSQADANLLGGGQGGDLPVGGAGDAYLPLGIALSLLALGLVVSGGIARKRATP